MKSAKQAKQESLEKLQLTKADIAILKGIEREVERSIALGEFHANFKCRLRWILNSKINLNLIEKALKEEGYDIIKTSSKTNPEDFALHIEIELSWEDA